ncbi:MAG: zf-HC2 domain-containing protein [Armatimonadota bacterium]|nr:zf-HC2 domain-containing protein [bacterium]
MKCTSVQEMFSAYMENAMEPPLRVAFEQHLAECSQCEADYQKFNASVMMLEELPELETPSGFHAAVMTRIERERLVKPRRVKWWNLDWQRVFTIRVPARAAVMGFAVLLLMVMMMQFTPASTVVADWFGIPRAVKNVVGNDPVDAPKLTHGRPSYSTANAGLSISVEPESDGVYHLHIGAKQTQPISFSIYEASADAVPGDVYQTGFVRQGERSTARISVSDSVECRVLDVTWNYGSQSYSRFVFLPSNFDAKASGKRLQLSMNDASMFDALKTISRSYGVVILATGDQNRIINYTDADSATPEEALYRSMMQAGMKWHAVDSSIYTVEPGD